MRTPTELTTLFRGRGLKVTPQRQCIFRLLHGATHHPTAEAVYEAARAEMPTISLRTVYQTLHDLADMGEILEVDVGTGSARFDPNTDAHHHLVCRRCGAVTDAYLDAGARVIARELHDPDGFAVESVEIVGRGLCRTCRNHLNANHQPTEERAPHA